MFFLYQYDKTLLRDFIAQALYKLCLYIVFSTLSKHRDNKGALTAPIFPHFECEINKKIPGRLIFSKRYLDFPPFTGQSHRLVSRWR